MSTYNLELQEDGELYDDKVSEGVDLHRDNLLNDFLEETSDNEDHSQKGNNNNNNDLESDDFLSELAESVVDKQGPSVAEPVAKLVGNHLARDYSKSKRVETTSRVNTRVEKIKTISVPANLTEFKTCRVNDGVYTKL